jgi:hypothetical protein
MARKRMISPEMFTSDTIAALPIPARWTWVGLLCYLDDEGRGKDNPSLVKASVWPQDDNYTPRKIKADLDRLETAGSVCRYTCCGVGQLHAPRWTSWQRISHPTPTLLCPCPRHDGPAHEIHAKDSRTAPAPLSPIELNVSEFKTPSDSPPDACRHGRARAEACIDCVREGRDETQTAVAGGGRSR